MEAKAKKLIGIPFIFVFLMGASQCSSIKYEDDIGFLNSAQANSMEYMVRVEGLICRDLEGKIGACTKRVKSDAAIHLKQDARPYAYRLDVRCTAATGIGFSVDIEKNKSWEYSIPSDKFKTLRSFSCQGEVFPQDRDNSLSALWQIRFIVFDDDYRARETIYHRDGHLVLGKFAKHSLVCDKGKCKRYHEKTVVKATAQARAYSESEVLRFNYYGY